MIPLHTSTNPDLECPTTTCEGRQDCTLCMEPLCQWHDDIDPRGTLDAHNCTGGWGLVHRECHETACTTPDCWL